MLLKELLIVILVIVSLNYGIIKKVKAKVVRRPTKRKEASGLQCDIQNPG